MSRTHEITISAFDLDRLEGELEGTKEELADAKATADLWIQKAKHADEAAADLKAELADTMREWKAELEEQARLLGMSAERECDLRAKLDRERALADRLAESLNDLWDNHTMYGAGYEVVEAALTAWKEARSE